MATKSMIDTQLIADHNDRHQSALQSDYAALGEKLGRAGLDIESITEQERQFAVALPSWGLGTGGPALPVYRALANRAIFSKR
jgi:L-rhamnose isomerase / sugar isomerase